MFLKDGWNNVVKVSMYCSKIDEVAHDPRFYLVVWNVEFKKGIVTIFPNSYPFLSRAYTINLDTSSISLTYYIQVSIDQK